MVFCNLHDICFPDRMAGRRANFPGLGKGVAGGNFFSPNLPNIRYDDVGLLSEAIITILYIGMLSVYSRTQRFGSLAILRGRDRLVYGGRFDGNIARRVSDFIEEIGN